MLERRVLSFKAQNSDEENLNPMIFRLIPPHFKVRTLLITHFYSYQFLTGSRFFHHNINKFEVIHTSCSHWFDKIVCTLFYFQPLCFDLHRDYIGKGLTPISAFRIVRKLDNFHQNPTLALRFFELSRVDFKLVHTFGTYNYMLRSLCQMGLHEKVKLVVDWMIIDGYGLDSIGLDHLVALFLEVGLFDVARKLLGGVQCREKGRNTFVYNRFLNALVRNNRVDEAVSFFCEEMISKACIDVCSINILIRGLCRAGNVDKGLKLFRDMRRFELFPDIITYNTMIDGLFRFNKVDEARDLFCEAKLRADILPNLRTYTSMISGYCKLVRMDVASSLYDEMTRVGITPGLFTLNALIDGFGKAGDMDSVSSMYEKMLSFGIQPDVITFTSRIDGCCRNGQVNEALKLCQEMIQRNLSPNEYTFSILIIALCKENRLHEACTLLEQFNLRNITPQAFIYNPVIDGLCKEGKVDEANALVSEMEKKRCKPDKYTFTILIIGHCMKGRMFEAIEIFNKMQTVKCTPDDITVKCLLSCLVKAGMPNEASVIKKHIALNNVHSGLPSSRESLLFRSNMNVQEKVQDYTPEVLYFKSAEPLTDAGHPIDHLFSCSSGVCSAEFRISWVISLTLPYMPLIDQGEAISWPQKCLRFLSSSSPPIFFQIIYTVEVNFHMWQVFV